jgi:hypothetical protein
MKILLVRQIWVAQSILRVQISGDLMLGESQTIPVKNYFKKHQKNTQKSQEFY